MTAGRRKSAHVYIRRDGARAIVVMMHLTPDGMPVEAPGPLSLAKWDASILGEAVQTALDQSAVVPRPVPSQ